MLSEPAPVPTWVCSVRHLPWELPLPTSAWAAFLSGGLAQMPTPTPLCPPWLGESFKYLRAHPHTLKPKCTEIRWPTLDPSGPSRRGRARKTIQVACEARLVPPRTSLLLPGPDLSSGAPALSCCVPPARGVVFSWGVGGHHGQHSTSAEGHLDSVCLLHGSSDAGPQRVC